MTRPYYRAVAVKGARKKRDAAAREKAGWRPISRRAYAAHLAAACAAVVLFASHRYATVMLEKGGRFEDPDAMFHAHRVVRTIQEGHFLPPVFDPFENFPDSGRALWPPLHDGTLALLARLGGSSASDPRRGLPLAAALPVLELALALLVAAALARRTTGPGGGVAAAWLFALTPCLPRRGAFGDIDHNLTEVLAALFLLFLAQSITGREETHASGLRRPIFSPILWAAAVLLALGFYAGLVLSAGIAAAALAARDVASPAAPALQRVSLGFGIAALFLPVFASLRVRPDPTDPWRLGPPYVLLLALAAVGTALVSLALAFARRRAFPPNPDLSAPLGLAAGLAAILTTSSRAWPALARGLGFLGARDPWLATIDEFQPLKTFDALPALVPAILVALVSVMIAASLGARRRLRLPPSLYLLVLAFATFTALGIVQKRFLPLAAAFGAAAGGAAWGLVRDNTAARWSLRAVFAAGVAVAGSAYLLDYAAMTLRREAAPLVLSGEVIADVLSKLTPQPANPPTWGVLAPWGEGHAILWRSGRAVALDNFGSMQPGFARAEALWLESSPARAVETLSRLRLRFVVASWPPQILPAAAAALGQDPAAHFAGGGTPGNPPPYRPTAAGERALLVRLHLRDAAPLPGDTPEDRAALARFRLVGASSESGAGPDGPVPYLKVFELLP